MKKRGATPEPDKKIERRHAKRQGRKPSPVIGSLIK